MTAIRTMLRALRSDKRGATAIEYGLIIALISIATIAAMTNIGTSMSRIYNNVNNNM